MRIQLDLDEEGMNLVERLKTATGSKTYKELFNNALTLLDWAIRQRHEERKIGSFDEQNKNYRELQMPALEHAATKKTEYFMKPIERERSST